MSCLTPSAAASTTHLHFCSSLDDLTVLTSSSSSSAAAAAAAEQVVVVEEWGMQYQQGMKECQCQQQQQQQQQQLNGEGAWQHGSSSTARSHQQQDAAHTVMLHYDDAVCHFYSTTCW
jgi:hypothetical protein